MQRMYRVGMIQQIRRRVQCEVLAADEDEAREKAMAGAVEDVDQTCEDEVIRTVIADDMVEAADLAPDESEEDHERLGRRHRSLLRLADLPRSDPDAPDPDEPTLLPFHLHGGHARIS